MPLERIVITLTKEGKFRGASATDFDDLPVPLSQTGLNSLLPSINTVALARVAELEAEIAANAEKVAAGEVALMTAAEQEAAKLQAVIDDASAKLAALPVSKVSAPAKL